MTSKDVEKARPKTVMRELGVSGLNRWDTRVSEEFLPELRGAQGRKIFHNMSSTDPTVGAVLFVIKQLIRSAEWDVRPSVLDSSKDSKDAAQFVDECLNDMSKSWDATVSSFCSQFIYGFSVNELVFKQRLGQDAKTPSAFDDGLIGVKKLPCRSQRTILDWAFDKHGGVHGCWQDDAQTNKKIWLPIEKILLFRVEDDYDNPEGRSLLANSYISWYFLRNFREILGISAERDLTGFPIIRVPAELLTNSEYSTELQNYKNLVANVRADELSGAVLPMDPDVPDMYKLELLSSPGKKSIDVSKIIDDLKTEITQTSLTDLILLGHNSVGSYALARTKQDALNISISSYLTGMAGVLNQHLVSKLMRVNSKFSNIKHYPTIVPRIKKLPNYAELAEMVRALAFASFHVSSDKKILNSVLDEYGLPLISDEEYDEFASNTVDFKVVPGSGKYLDKNKEIDDNEDVGEADSMSIKVEEDGKEKD